MLRSILATRPLVWIGRLSYGLYLFHWPLDVLFVPSRVHMHGLALNALRLAFTFAAATALVRADRVPDSRGQAPGVAVPAPRGAARTAAQRRSLAGAARVGATLTVVVASGAGASAPPSYLTGSSAAFVRVPEPADPHRGDHQCSEEVCPVANSAPAHGRPTVDARARGTDDHAAHAERSLGLRRPAVLQQPAPAGDAARRATRPAGSGRPISSGPATNLRILVLGDSTACSLFPGLKAVDDEVGAATAQAAVFGCGIASGQITTTRGEQITPHTERCPAMVEAAQVPAVGIMRPDVVIWMSLWEKSDMIADGSTLVSGTPAGDAEMLRRMDATSTRVTAYGAKVVLLTIAAPAPNDAQGTNNTSNGVDDAGYARLDHLDREFARRHPGTVTLVDLAPTCARTDHPAPRRSTDCACAPTVATSPDRGRHRGATGSCRRSSPRSGSDERIRTRSPREVDEPEARDVPSWTTQPAAGGARRRRRASARSRRSVASCRAGSPWGRRRAMCGCP